jgi:hypothetical protein
MFQFFPETNVSYNLKNILAEKVGKNVWHFLLKILLVRSKMNHNIRCQKPPSFAEKTKVAKNSIHNIDPRNFKTTSAIFKFLGKVAQESI